MPVTALDTLLLAFHGGGGGDGNPMILIVFLAVAATGAWLLFSGLRWRNTMIVAGVGWLAVLALAFVF
jgi:hypothetical protein